jgi:hypothetical protein
VNKKESKLLDGFRQLPAEAQQSLLDYVEFLTQRYPAAPIVQQGERVEIPRPENETVIAAIKRLSKTYPMLNKDKLLHETTGLVTDHMIRGRDAAEVINELESVFERHYLALKHEQEQ